MIDILLKYIFWYEFLNDLGAQRDFEKKNCHKKAGPGNHSYLKYALDLDIKIYDPYCKL